VLPDVPPGTLQTKEAWKQVLIEHREAIVQSADRDDVVLDYVLDHLISKRCIQVDHYELVKREPKLRSRINKLLHFISSEGRNTFDELCNAFENFGTDDKRQLANSLRQIHQDKDVIIGRHITTLFMLECSEVTVK